MANWTDKELHQVKFDFQNMKASISEEHDCKLAEISKEINDKIDKVSEEKQALTRNVFLEIDTIKQNNNDMHESLLVQNYFLEKEVDSLNAKIDLIKIAFAITTLIFLIQGALWLK